MKPKNKEEAKKILTELIKTSENLHYMLSNDKISREIYTESSSDSVKRILVLAEKLKRLDED